MLHTAFFSPSTYHLAVLENLSVNAAVYSGCDQRWTLLVTGNLKFITSLRTWRDLPTHQLMCTTAAEECIFDRCDWFQCRKRSKLLILRCDKQRLPRWPIDSEQPQRSWTQSYGRGQSIGNRSFVHRLRRYSCIWRMNIVKWNRKWPPIPSNWFTNKDGSCDEISDCNGGFKSSLCVRHHELRSRFKIE